MKSERIEIPSQDPSPEVENIHASSGDQQINSPSKGLFLPEDSPAGKSMEHRAIKDIKPHPLNGSLYGDSIDEGLFESIKEKGIIEPLAILPDNTLVGGHCRLAVAKKLGMDRVPVRIVNSSEDTDSAGLLIELNIGRKKTTEMRLREYAKLKEIEAKEAKARQGHHNIPPNSAGSGSENASKTVATDKQPISGEARDIAAAKVGLGHTASAIGLTIISAIEEHKDDDNAKRLREVLNGKSINAALKAGRALGWIEPAKARPKAVKQKGQAGPQETLHGNRNADLTHPAQQRADATNQDAPKVAKMPPEIAVDPQAIATNTAETQDTDPEHRPFTFANGSDFSFVGWRDGIIDLPRLRQEIESRAKNPQDGPNDVAENQLFIVELAKVANILVPPAASAGSLRNLHDAVLWLARVVEQMSRKSLSV